METKTIDELEEQAHRAETEFKTKLHSLEDHVAQKVGEVTENVEEVATDVKDFVRNVNPIEQTKRHPLIGVSSAAVVGAYVGFQLGGPAKRLVHQQAAKLPVLPKHTGPSFFEEAALVLLASPLAAAAADWGRKKYPDYTWAIDAVQKMSGFGGGVPTHQAQAEAPSTKADGAHHEEAAPHDDPSSDIFH